MTAQFSVIALPAIAALAGCDGEKTYDAERKTKIAQGKNDRGELKHAPNRQNTKKAADELTFSNKNAKIPQF